MKRIFLACASLLLVSLPLAAAGTPARAPAPPLNLGAPAVCPLGSPANTGPQKPTFLTTYQGPCAVEVACSDGSHQYCSSSFAACMMQEGCWVICEDNVIHRCPGTERDPECVVY
jgi:hypothetical protein